MTTEDVNKARARRLIAAREHHGLEDATAGAAFLSKALRKTISRDTYIQHENGTRGITRAVDDYAAGYKVKPGWLLWGDSPPHWYRGEAQAAPPKPQKPGNIVELRTYLKDREVPRPLTKFAGKLRPIGRDIPVMGDVAAGLWKEADSREAWQATEHIRLDVPGYESASLYAMRVVGPSMNLVYPPGRYVVVAPTAEAGVRPGDYVIVERSRSGLVEITIKQLEVEDGAYVLWPRSSDPEFQEPIRLTGELGDQDRPRLIGVVVAEYAMTRRPPPEGYHELPKSFAE